MVLQFGDDHREAVLASHLLDPLDDLHRVPALQLVEDEFDEGSRGGALLLPAVPVLAYKVLDQGAGLGGDLGPAVDDLGDGRGDTPASSASWAMVSGREGMRSGGVGSLVVVMAAV
ncbi:hypothetical protein GCM10027612_60840 [Microbispora bryophytorum subsp. camponoti]